MHNNNETAYINFLKSYENKPIKLILKNGFKYITSNLEILNDSVCKFTDNKNEEVMIVISEIAQVTKEVQSNG